MCQSRKPGGWDPPGGRRRPGGTSTHIARQRVVEIRERDVMFSADGIAGDDVVDGFELDILIVKINVPAQNPESKAS